ncbi:MAG TPA: hypothetical protein PLL30_06670 [Candidatus Krumholzibacteria bacterium]|nr:hypothetical protein [Candidatus Krumholzibacteria bacterium]HPD71445.1 hypothetical protein [Candidatus Krumholzibacteria bacterium]HRY41622.1 hypothetical protein [Candidatus Krumholzibacteria bacterium]
MKRTCSVFAAAALLLALGAAPAVAGDVGQWLDSDDWRGWLGSQGIGAQEIGGTRDLEPKAGAEPGAPGDRSRRLKAGALSLVVPGLGQLYNHDRTKGLFMIGAEVVIWGAYLGFDRHADQLGEDARNWAGIYAGTSGEHEDGYWQAVGRYPDSDAWYESRLREARAFGTPPPPPPGEADTWQWRNDGYRTDYQSLRADANSAYDHRNLMLLFAVLNRAVSIFDAVRDGGTPPETAEPTVGATLLGLDVSVAMGPSIVRPEARAVASWSF